ncbi:MAG: WavE lipopolysaccharide synthesis family protein, partial [Candidatus Thermochlorobacter sp.]
MKVGIVETSDISIVVQGPIVSNKDFYPNGWTNEALRRMRIHFPGAEIILSTWKGSNVDGLDYDVVVFNDDPGSAMSRNRPYNVNRQIVSTKNGLAKASRKYALKT